MFSLRRGAWDSSWCTPPHCAASPSPYAGVSCPRARRFAHFSFCSLVFAPCVSLWVTEQLPAFMTSGLVTGGRPSCFRTGRFLDRRPGKSSPACQNQPRGTRRMGRPLQVPRPERELHYYRVWLPSWSQKTRRRCFPTIFSATRNSRTGNFLQGIAKQLILTGMNRQIA
jgi:hypothetical protein